MRPEPRAVPCAVPGGARIVESMEGAYFQDCYRIDVDGPPQTALGHLLTAISRTPGWVEALMRMRNRLVGFVGLKNLGTLGGIDPDKPESAYVPGDRVGVFTLRSSSPEEVIVADDDKHLEVLLSLVCLPGPPGNRRTLCLTTVVHVHNRLGRFYMLPVAPLHRIIAPAVLSRLAV